MLNMKYAFSTLNGNTWNTRAIKCMRHSLPGRPTDHAQNHKQIEYNSAVQSTMWWNDEREKKTGTKCGNQDANYMAPEHWKHDFLSAIKNTFEQTLPNHPYENVAPETQNGSLIICWGQGTLKLPMSFSKFSLCPPLGAACHMLQQGKEMWKSWIFIESMRIQLPKQRLPMIPWLRYFGKFRPCSEQRSIIYNADHSEDHASHARNSKSSRIKSSTPKLSAYPVRDLWTSGTFKLPTPIPPTLPPINIPALPYLPRFHLSRAQTRRDGRSQGASGIQERSQVRQAVEGLQVFGWL